MSECPESQVFERYARDDLSDKQTESLEQHLTQCRTCFDRYVASGQRDSLPIIANYHMVKELGSGRFGVVYKAWWLKDRPRLVALKCLSPAGGMEKERFDREIQVLKGIDSPSIVKCLDSGTFGGTSYFVMDYVRGDHLDEYLQISTSSLDEKLLVFERVSRAVAEAHAQGVIHRDLKPRNILVDANGHPHMLDFGICALEEEGWSSSARHTITHFGDIVGTLKYMSPEQAWGGVSGPIDERSDVWALGIMLYEIVTNGDYPYDLGPTADKPAHEALLERIRKEMPALPKLSEQDRGRQLEILLERCLSWEPQQRLQSAAQLADDIERYRANQRIKTKPLSIPHRMRRLAVGIATKARWAALLALVATGALALWATTLVFDVRWQVTGRAYSGGAQAAMFSSAVNNESDVVIVGVSDSTVDAVTRLAPQSHFEGVTSDIKSWRAVHGFLLERLAEAGPRAVAWDYYFRTPQPGDARFVQGVTALAKAGVPVILGAADYDADGSPDLSPDILAPLGRRANHGAIYARDMVEREGEFVMAIGRPDGSVIPGLALVTLAAVLHPEARLDTEWPNGAGHLSLLYEAEPGSYLRERDRIALSKWFKSGLTQFAVNAGDQLACTTFELRRPAQWAAKTVPYEVLLTCSPETLREKVADKVLIIGDLREPRIGFIGDRHRVKYGSEIIDDVPGCYLIGDAVAGLLHRRYIKSAFPIPATTFLCMLLLAATGSLLPIGVAAREELEPRRNRRILWTGLLSLSTVCYLAMILVERYDVVHAGMAGFSMLAPMCGSFWVEFARARHRILDKERRSVEDLKLEPDRTLTILRWPSRSLPAEQ